MSNDFSLNNRDSATPAADALDPTFFDRVIAARQQKEAELTAATDRSLDVLRRHSDRYQQQQSTAGKFSSLGTDSDAVRTVVGGAVSGVGSIADGFGRIQEMMNGPNLSEPLKALGQKLQEAGDFARGSVSLETQRSIDDSRITGDVFDPESWDFGDAPSAEGYAYQLLSVLGEFAPQAAGLLAKSPKAAQGIMGLIGFMQAGSGQAQDAAEYLGNMDDETFFNNVELAQTLREANPNMTNDEIRQEVTRTAEATSMLVGGAVGGIGGAATGYILRPMQKALPGNALVRGATTVGISGFEEGVQETAEPILSRAVTNAVIGDDRDTTEGTLEGAVLGTSFGGGLGAGGAAVEAVDRKLKDVQQKNAERVSKEKKQNVGIVSAITEGRFEDLTDPAKREDYPRNVTTSALGKVALDEKVDPEVRKQASDALATIEAEIAAEIQNEQSVEAGLQRRTETLEETEDLLATYTEQLKEAKTNQASPEEVAELQETVDFLQEDLDAVKAEIDSGPKPDSKRMAALQQELTSVSELRKNAVVERTVDDLNTLVSQVSSTDTPDDVRASSTQKLLTAVQTNPDALDVDQLKALGSPSNRSLSDDDRRFIRQLTAAKIQENTLKSMDTVGADIFTDQPDRGYISLPKYKSLISGALQRGDIDSATKSLEMLESFMKDHKAKAENARTALKNAQQSGKDQVVLADRGVEAGWRTEERTGFWTKGRLKEKGSLYVGANSKKLVDQISKEAQVISSNHAVLKKAIERTSAQQPESGTTSEVPTTPDTATSNQTSDVPPWEDESTSEPTPVTANDSSEDGRLSGKRAAYQAAKESGTPDDIASLEVVRHQERANERSEPMNLWLSESGARGLVPASSKSPFRNGKVIATFYPETAPEPSEAASQADTVTESQITEGLEKNAPKKEVWHGVVVYTNSDGMKPGDFKRFQLTPDDPNDIGFNYISEDGKKIAGNYLVSDTVLADFNIASEDGPSSLKGKEIRKIARAILEAHPNATKLHGFRISGMRAKAGVDASVTFSIKDGRLVLDRAHPATATDTPTQSQETTTRKLQGPVMRGQDPEEMSSIQLKKVTETLAERFGKSQELIALGGKATEDMDVLRQDLKLLADFVLVESPEAVRSLFDLMVSKDAGVTLDELVEWGTKNATNRAQRGLLKALAGHAKVKDVRAFTLYTLDLAKTAESSKDSGMYFPSTHTIGIDPLTMTRGQNTHEFAVDTVIHEMIHAISYDRIANDPEFRKEIDEISDIIRDWMKNNDTSVLYDSGAFEYAISDPNGQELLSTFFGSPRLMADLQRIPDPVKKQSVFQKFVTALKKSIQRAFPGMEVAEANIMDRVLALGNELFQDSLFEEVFDTQTESVDPAPIRNDANQQDMEETHPGILPWESVDEYEQRIIEEDGTPETPQSETPATGTEETPVTKYTMTQLRSEIIPQQGNELTFGEVLNAIMDSGFIPVFRSMSSPDGDVVRVDAANKSFQFRGLTFAAHKVEGLWVVTELGTGLNTGKFQKTQKGTIELAKERLGQASEETIKKFIEQSEAMGVTKLQERYLAQDGDVTAEESESTDSPDLTNLPPVVDNAAGMKVFKGIKVTGEPRSKEQREAVKHYNRDEPLKNFELTPEEVTALKAAARPLEEDLIVFRSDSYTDNIAERAESGYRSLIPVTTSEAWATAMGDNWGDHVVQRIRLKKGTEVIVIDEGNTGEQELLVLGDSTTFEIENEVSLDEEQSDIRYGTGNRVKLIEVTASPKTSTEKPVPVYWFQQTPLEPFSGQMTADEIRSLNKMTYFTVSTNRALTKVPNFFSTTLSQAKRDLSVLAPFIRGGTERLEKLQQKENLEEYLDAVITHMDAFNKQIDKMFVNSADKDKFGNPLSYLANPETGQLDENTKTAISQAALAFVLENGNDVWSNSTDKELRAVLLLDETEAIDSYARVAVLTAGRRHNSVVQELGRRAYQAAGLKIRPDAPKNEEQQITNAMGEMALSVLFSKTEASQQPYMHRYAVKDYVFNEEFRNFVQGSGLLEKFHNDKSKDKRSLTKEEKGIVSDYFQKEHYFVRSNRIADDRDVNTFHKNLELQRLKELAKGTQNFLDDVFGVEHTKVLATTEPVEFTQKRAKNSPGLVPSMLAEAVNTDNHRAIKLDGDLLRKDENNPGIFHKISRELLGFIAGKEETEGRNIHRLNRDGIKGKNDAIDREIEQLLDETLEDLLEGDIEKPFYTQKTVWKMHRVGHTSNTFNAQNSKLHRYSAHLDGWEYSVDAKNPNDKNHQEFKLALMDALGEKTDNESPEKVLERFSKSIMENETFMAAMPVMRALLTDPDYRIEDSQSAEAQTILAALNEAGEGAHSFAGLVNLAKYLEAQNGTGTFTTTLSREGDGKNNGPIISNLMMGLPADAEGQDALMNMGGIFTEGQEYKNYGDYAEKVGLDLYKKLASSANERMQEKLEGLENPKEFAPLRLIHAVIGNFVDEETGNVTSAGRTAVKQPLTSMIFGAGVAGTIDNMGGDFVHGIYTLFEQAYGDPEQVRLLLSGLNEVMDWANSQRKYPKEPGTYRMATNQRNVLNTVFNEAQETLLSEAFKEVLGQQIKESLEEQYGDFLENRSAMNNAANMTFRLYDFAYQHERRNMLAEIQEKTGNDYQDLTSEQEKELDKKVSRLFPMMHTAFSKASGQSHRYGLPLLKQKRGQAEEGNQYTVQTKFRNLNVVKFPVDKKKGPIIPLNSMKAEGVVFRYVEPGAGTVVLATHSTDTYPAAQVYMKYLALNSHDAVHGPAPLMPEMIQYMNETFLDAMGDTSIAENVMEALYRTMDEFVKWESEIVDGMSEEELAAWEQQKQEAIPPKERVYSKGGKFTEIPSSLSIEEHAALWLDKASAAHQRRNKFLSRVTKVSQYYVGGGDFNVPDAKRQELQKKLEGDTLATQLMKQRAKRLGRDPVYIQNRLNEVIASGEARINDNSGKLTKQVIQTLREITVAQHKQGDLNKALGVVLRGPENSEARDFYRSIIMGGSPVWNSWIEGNQTILDQVVELKEIHKKSQKKRPQGSYTPGSANNIKNYTTQEMLSVLSQKEGLTKGHATELATLMDSIVNNLHGTFGAKKAAIEAKSGETPVDLMIRSEQEGVYPFTTKAAGSGVALNSAERFVVEQIELAMREAFDGKSLADREFLKLFREARNTIKPEDLYPGDLVKAQEIHDFIFRLDTSIGDNRSTHLSRFVALGLVYPPLKKALDFATAEPDARKGDKVGDRLQHGFETAVQMLSNEVNKTYTGERANKRMEALVTRLVYNEKKHKLSETKKESSTLREVEQLVEKARKNSNETIAKIANSPTLTEHKYKTVRTGAKLTAILAEDRADELLKALEDFRNHEFRKKPLGFFMSTLNEIRGETEETTGFYQALAKTGQIEQERKNILENLRKEFLERFENHQDLTKQEKAGITQVFLRNDLSSLLDGRSSERVLQLVRNRRELDKEIQDMTKQVVANNRFAGYHMHAIKDLAYYLATGRNVSENLVLNAHNIAHLYGTPWAGKNTQAANQVQAIDQLVSLYALKYTPPEQRSAIRKVMEHERNRGDENALAYLLTLHRGIKQDALQELFDGNPVQMMKGYTKEIYNPHIRVVATDSVNGQKLVEQGWEHISKLSMDDSLDSRTGLNDEHLYVLKDAGLQDYVTGILSNTGMQAKGTEDIRGSHVGNSQHQTTLRNSRMKRIGLKKTPGIREMAKYQADYDPSKRKSGKLAPVFDDQGNVANYRYLMNHSTKDSVLERNNNFEDVLAGTAASQYDKLSSADHNKEVIQALHSFYKQDYAKNQNAWIEVSDESADPRLREAYRLLPDATRQEIIKTFGQNKLFIRNDLLDLLLGYRKYSMSDVFNRESHERNALQNFLVDILEQLYGKQAALKVRRAEDMWQATVKLVKDVWVIRNLTTLLGNVMSNTTLLLAYGVPPSALIQGHREAIEGLMTYQKTRNELLRVQANQKAGVGNLDEQAEKIREMEFELDRNPVKDLVDAGMFQTIMEDIDAEKDDYNYESLFDRTVNDWVGKLPDPIKKTGEVLTVGKDTTLYKLLFKGTQMSDFVGRYVLYNHLKKKEGEKLTNDQILKRVREAFVNYDAPTHRGMQYGNDMGLIFFTKYYMRIQKVIWTLMHEHPARALGVVVASNYLGGLSHIFNSSALGRVGNNPFDVGAVNITDMASEPIPLKILLSFFD